ncbi:MAG: aldehyde ferredoxin oxidoreductase C-terminal domain-containing protein, partial [Oscillospiraceae bacterium]
MKGYTGKILTIDLATGDSKVISIKDEVYENILSGVGLGVWWCYRNIPAGADPLGPENVIGLISGLLTDTGSCITGRWVAVTKSPSTGGIGEANCGGTFAPGIKACGYDAIFFTGRSEKPVYVYIDNKGPQIRDASNVWGLDATESEEVLIKECWTGKKKPVACTIGLAGEKLSWMAGICNDRGRIAARQGVGGVMGSKNLKGVVLAGTRPVSCEDPQGMKALSKRCAKRIKLVSLPPIVPTGILHVARLLPELELSPDGLFTGVMMGTWGTGGASTFAAVIGEAPIKNWAGSTKDFGLIKTNKVDGSKLLSYQKNRYFCHSCVYGCGGESDISKTKYSYDGNFKMSHKPEYETQWVFTGILCSDDADMMLWINEYLNRAGMDTISAGHSVAMAIECYENGLLTKEDFNGLEMTWGNAKSIMEFTKMMVERRGIGDVFADGVKRASETLGPKTAKYAVHAGGMEPPMHDSRSDSNLATFYAVDPTPAKHTTGGYLYYGCMHLWKKVSWAPQGNLVGSAEKHNTPSETEALKVAAAAYYRRLVDGVGGCYFAMILGVDTYPVFDWLNIATGWNKTPDEYM